jgi:hypothetical protein
VKIFAVSAQDKFKVLENPGSPPVDRSIAEIRMITNNISAMGITLTRGGQSPDPAYDLIYYDMGQGIGALTHELFGHEWLALKGAPSVHPPPGSAQEKTIGTIRPSDKILDPFGLVFAGTVREYIAKYVESLGTNVVMTTSTGQQVSVPQSPTQQIGPAAYDKAFSDLTTQAATGLTQTTYSAPVAQAWRIVCNNYDLMQTNAAAMQAGNSNLTYTREVVLLFCYLLFGIWNSNQQAGFRILLADFNGSRAGFKVNELSSKLEALVGAAKSPYSSP